MERESPLPPRAVGGDDYGFRLVTCALCLRVIASAEPTVKFPTGRTAHAKCNAIGVAMGLVQRLPREESPDLRLPNPPSTSSSSTFVEDAYLRPDSWTQTRERVADIFSSLPTVRDGVYSSGFICEICLWSRNPPGTLRWNCSPNVRSTYMHEVLPDWSVRAPHRPSPPPPTPCRLCGQGCTTCLPPRGRH